VNRNAGDSGTFTAMSQSHAKLGNLEAKQNLGEMRRRRQGASIATVQLPVLQRCNLQAHALHAIYQWEVNDDPNHPEFGWQIFVVARVRAFSPCAWREETSSLGIPIPVDAINTAPASDKNGNRLAA